MKQQFVSCQICGSDSNVPFLAVPNRFDIKETFNLVKCTKCSFVFLNPRPDPEMMGVYYEDDRYQPHRLGDKSYFDRLYHIVRDCNIRYKRYLIERYFQKGSILDFGCGSGEFLIAMRNAGWQVYGVESAQKPRELSKNFMLDVQEKIASFNDKFDVITLWHVLEHIHDIHNMIEKLKERLNKNGILLVAVPNLKSYDAQKFGVYWAAYDAPRHLYHFSPIDVCKIFKMHDMHVTNYRTLFVDTWYNSLLSLQLEASIYGKKNLLRGAMKFGTIAFLSTILETIAGFYSSSFIYVVKVKRLTW